MGVLPRLRMSLGLLLVVVLALKSLGWPNEVEGAVRRAVKKAPKKGVKKVAQEASPFPLDCAEIRAMHSSQFKPLAQENGFNDLALFGQSLHLAARLQRFGAAKGKDTDFYSIKFVDTVIIDTIAPYAPDDRSFSSPFRILHTQPANHANQSSTPEGVVNSGGAYRGRLFSPLERRVENNFLCQRLPFYSVNRTPLSRADELSMQSIQTGGDVDPEVDGTFFYDFDRVQRNLDFFLRETNVFGSGNFLIYDPNYTLRHQSNLTESDPPLGTLVLPLLNERGEGGKGGQLSLGTTVLPLNSLLCSENKPKMAISDYLQARTAELAKVIGLGVPRVSRSLQRYLRLLRARKVLLQSKSDRHSTDAETVNAGTVNAKMVNAKMADIEQKLRTAKEGVRESVGALLYQAYVDTRTAVAVLEGLYAFLKSFAEKGRQHCYVTEDSVHIVNLEFAWPLGDERVLDRMLALERNAIKYDDLSDNLTEDLSGEERGKSGGRKEEGEKEVKEEGEEDGGFFMAQEATRFCRYSQGMLFRYHAPMHYYARRGNRRKFAALHNYPFLYKLGHIRKEDVTVIGGLYSAILPSGSTTSSTTPSSTYSPMYSSFSDSLLACLKPHNLIPDVEGFARIAKMLTKGTVATAYGAIAKSRHYKVWQESGLLDEPPLSLLLHQVALLNSLYTGLPPWKFSKSFEAANQLRKTAENSCVKVKERVKLVDAVVAPRWTQADLETPGFRQRWFKNVVPPTLAATFMLPGKCFEQTFKEDAATRAFLGKMDEKSLPTARDGLAAFDPWRNYWQSRLREMKQTVKLLEEW